MREYDWEQIADGVLAEAAKFRPDDASHGDVLHFAELLAEKIRKGQLRAPENVG